MNPMFQAALDLLARSPAITAVPPGGMAPPPPIGTAPTAPPGANPVRIEQQNVLNMIEIEVLGHYPDGSVDIYSRPCRQTNRIPSVARLAYADLILWCGEQALTCVHPGRDIVSGLITMDQVRNAIAYFGNMISLADAVPMGQGVWRADGEVTLINAGQAVTYDHINSALIDVNTPRVGCQTLDFSSTEPWVDFAILRGNLTSAADPNWCRDRFKEVQDIFSNWYWRFPRDRDLTASLACVTWIQTLLPWRPEVALTGESDSGKSALMKQVLAPFFGRLAMQTEQASEAGIRQEVKNRSLAILLDEFDKNRERQKILHLFRSASTGGVIRKGTRDHRGATFRMQHIPWMAAIDSGLVEAADKNRCIVLHLDDIPKANRGALTLPRPRDVNILGLEMLAVTLRHLPTTLELFEFLKTQRFQDVHGRQIEAYAVPAALMAAIMGMDRNAAAGLLGAFLEGKFSNQQGFHDRDELMRCILESQFDARPGVKMSVSAALANENAYQEHHAALERNGIAIRTANTGRPTWGCGPGHFLVLNTRSVLRYLLRGTRWYDMDIDQILERLPRADWQRTRIDSKRVVSLWLPAQNYLERSMSPEEEASRELDANSPVGLDSDALNLDLT